MKIFSLLFLLSNIICSFAMQSEELLGDNEPDWCVICDKYQPLVDFFNGKPLDIVRTVLEPERPLETFLREETTLCKILSAVQGEDLFRIQMTLVVLQTLRARCLKRRMKMLSWWDVSMCDSLHDYGDQL